MSLTVLRKIAMIKINFKLKLISKSMKHTHVYTKMEYQHTIVSFKKKFYVMFIHKKLRCKTNMLTILMHQIRISTTKVSSVMLRSKGLEIRKKGKLEEPSDENEIECHEILSQIRRRIELCLREIIIRFELNLQNLLLFLTV